MAGPSLTEAISVAAGVLQSLDREAQSADMIRDPSNLRGIGGFEQFGLEDPRTVSYGYWRKPDGRITFEQYRHNTYDRFMRKWQLLPQYGEYKLIGQGAWNPHMDPYAALVVAGGAFELPVEQVRELRWHRQPAPTERGAHARVWALVSQHVARGIELEDAIEQVLPQLVPTDWRTWRDYRCQFCPQRVWNTADDVARHESVMHREDVRTREMRDSISDALSKSGDQQAPILQALAGLMAQFAQDGQDQRAVMLELLGALKDGRDKNIDPGSKSEKAAK